MHNIYTGFILHKYCVDITIFLDPIQFTIHNETHFLRLAIYIRKAQNLMALQEFAPKFLILMVGADTHNHTYDVIRYNSSN